MKKKALHKEFYMEIRKSLGRFLSIFMIVAMGVAFLSGIRATEPDMRISGDEYFDRNHLMDVKVMGTFGISEDDVLALRNLPGVEQVEGGYSTDVICDVQGSQKVMHVMALSDKFNNVQVAEGRLPKAPDECLMDEDFIEKSSYKIGDTIKLQAGDDGDLGDTLSVSEFKIVGIGNSSCYITFERGSSMIGTGEVSAFLIVPEKTFVTEVYTECYLSVQDARQYTAFTPEYEEKIDAVVKEAEGIADVRCQARKDSIVEEAEKELDDARQEYEDGKKEAEEELAKNEKKLKDAEKELKDGKQKIKDGEKAIRDAKGTIKDKKKELDDAQKKLDAGKKELEAGRKEFDSQKKEYDQKMQEAAAGFRAKDDELAKRAQKVKEGQDALAARKKELDDEKLSIQELEREYEDYISQPEYDEAKAQEMSDQIALRQEAYEKDLKEFEEREAKERPALMMEFLMIANEKKYVDEAKKQFLEEKEKNDALFAENEAPLLENEKKMQDSERQLKDGYKQWKSGKRELEDQEKKLKDSAKTIEDGEKELKDGFQEFEDAKKEVEEELKDAEKKLKDAEDELAKVENPKWYVEDRGILTEYNSYGENADRMGAIGRVFPALFFLVAALISLTTMTRMVEEQRMQIGTLKALGYSKASIAGKYIGYALLATMGGSVFGILIGEKIFPYIIVNAYKIMYTHIPDIILPYHMKYALEATAAAVLCTMAATILACYKELASQPAVLMRPPSPKQGKRILIERITFLWKHLSFTWKSTLRNLFRYKKRFFMTIFGIGGCMALLLVGYGIRDSIFNIAVVQYDELQTYSASVFMDEEISNADRTSIMKMLDGEKEVTDYAEVFMKNVTVYSEEADWDTYIMAVKDTKKMDSFVHLRDRLLHTPYQFSDKGAVISEKTAKKLGVKKGDSIWLRNARDEKKEVKIIEICENYMGHYLYLTAAGYEDVYGREPEYNCILIKTDVSGRDPLDKEPEPELKKIGEKLLKYDDVMNVQYMDNVKGKLNDMLGTLDSVIVVLIISAGMLAFVVLYNLNNININERKRELATIKVLGFYDLEVAEYVYRENILLTFIGAAVGCVLGNLLHQYIIVTVEVDAVMFGRIIHPASYIYSVLFTFAFSIIVNWVMYFKLKKINMVESLKSVE